MISTDIARFRNMVNKLDISKADKQNAIDRFQDLIENTYLSPDDCFDFIDCGYFKEVYWLDDEHKYVIKFVRESNDTSYELKILRLARKKNLSQIFIPTSALILTNNITPSEELKDSAEDDDIYINTIMIQPAIDRTCTDMGEISKINPYSLKEYNSNPLIVNNNVIDYRNIAKSKVDNKSWLETVAKFYGEDYLQRLVLFTLDNYISDLHDGNIGYYKNGKPVIIDFMKW